MRLLLLVVVMTTTLLHNRIMNAPATMSLEINLHTLDVSDERTQTAINHKKLFDKIGVDSIFSFSSSGCVFNRLVVGVSSPKLTSIKFFIYLYCLLKWQLNYCLYRLFGRVRPHLQPNQIYLMFSYSIFRHASMIIWKW